MAEAIFLKQKLDELIQTSGGEEGKSEQKPSDGGNSGPKADEVHGIGMVIYSYSAMVLEDIQHGCRTPHVSFPNIFLCLL